MSSFFCQYCGKAIIDTEKGYITGCEHYPIHPRHDKKGKGLELSGRDMITELLNRKPKHEIPEGQENKHIKSMECKCRPYKADIWGMRYGREE